MATNGKFRVLARTVRSTASDYLAGLDPQDDLMPRVWRRHAYLLRVAVGLDITCPLGLERSAALLATSKSRKALVISARLVPATSARPVWQA